MSGHITKPAISRSLQAAAIDFKNVLRGLRYAGKNVVCPCCGGCFRTFLPYGAHGRPNALCPRCLCLERHRLLWLYFRDKTDLFKADLSVLHLAPEAVLQKALKSLPNLTYVSTDIASSLAMVKADVQKAAFKDKSFDVIICSHVLEHVPDDSRAMRELARILKPGGWAIIQCPIDQSREETFEPPGIERSEERERLFDAPDHVRVYGRDYRARLEGAGFSVRVDPYAWGLGTRLVARHALIPEDIYVCTRVT
ncbi:MAG: methyltransferase domain-containing protein [Candidatus Eisenbacteria bacterium]